MSARCSNWDADWGGCGSCTHCLAEQAAARGYETGNQLDRIEAKLDALLAAIEGRAAANPETVS